MLRTSALFPRAALWSDGDQTQQLLWRRHGVENLFADADDRKIVSDSIGPIADHKRGAAMAVISALQSKPSAYLQGLFSDERAVAIFEKTDRGTKVRAKDVLVLVNYLHFITWRYRASASGPGYPQLKID
jgi:hypothetical protein